MVAYDKALALLDEVLRTTPQSAATRHKARNVHWDRALTNESMSDWDSAAADWAAAMEFDAGGERTKLRAKRARSLAMAGDHVTAALDAEVVFTAADSSAPAPTVTDKYNAVTAFSLASAVVDVEESLPELERAELREQYAARAVKYLAIMIESGDFDAPENRELLRTDSDLEPLRDRADFDELIDSLVGTVALIAEFRLLTLCGSFDLRLTRTLQSQSNCCCAGFSPTPQAVARKFAIAATN